MTNNRFLHNPVSIVDLAVENSSAGRRYVTPEGKKYPSITTVLGAGDKSWLHEWRARVGEEEANKISARAANRGTIVHTLMEDYINGKEIDTKKLMPDDRFSFKKLSPIIDTGLTEVYGQEVALYSDYLKVAGRCDLIGKWDRVNSIVDFKTSRRVKKKEDITNYFVQATAYSIMFEERTGIPVPNLVIVMDIDDHSPVVFKEHRDNWDGPLKKAIQEYYRLERCKVL